MSSRLSHTGIMLPFLIVTTVVVLLGCGGGNSPSAPLNQTQTPAESAVEPGQVNIFQVRMHPQPPLVEGFKGVSIANPQEITFTIPRKVVSAGAELARQASEYDVALPNDNVSEGTIPGSLQFEPGTDQGGGLLDLAYSTYQFILTDYTGQQTVGINWIASEEPSDWSQFFIGLANFGSNQWEWFTGPADGVLTIDDFAPYTQAGEVWLVVSVSGGEPCSLEQLQIGQDEIRGTGDEGFADATPAPPPPINPGDGELAADVDLSPYCSPINDQGTWGSCTAFATGDGAYNYELNRIYNEYGWDLSDPYNRVSPKHLYVESGILQGFPADPSYGRWTDDVVGDLTYHGVATEQNAPYDFNYDDDWTIAAEADADLLTISDWDEIGCNTEAGIEGVKNVLYYQARPLVMRTALDSDFMSYEGGTVWNYTGPSVGGHAMCIVGYSDDAEAFKVRNSWSNYWGEYGYVWIGYDTFLNEDAAIRCFVLSDDYDQDVADRFLTSPPPPLETPGGLTATTGERSDYIELSWNSVEDATGYTLFRDDPTHVVQVLGAITTWNDIEIDDAHSYTYWVQAFNDEVESDQSAADIGYLGLAPNITRIRGAENLEIGVGDFYQGIFTGSLPLTVEWDFGGGGTPDSSTEYIPFIDFDTEGVFDCSLVVDNDYGTDTFNFQVTVYDPSGPNDQPIAVLSRDPISGEAPLTVIWDGSDSYDPDGSIMTYRFVGNEQAGSTYEETYYTAGTHGMYFEVQDNNGLWSEQEYQTVEVTAPVQAWELYDVDTQANTPSTMIDLSGLPGIAYFKTDTSEVVFTKATDTSWTNWSTPAVIETTDAASYVQSLESVDGMPALLYYDSDESKVFYCRATAADGSNWGTPIDPLDGSGDSPGGFSELRIVNGNPAFGYYETGADDLMFVRATDATGTAWDTPTLVYGTNDVGSFSDLEVVNGRPAFSFYDQTNRQLYYTRADDASGSTWPASPFLISTEDYAGWGNDLCADAANPAIAFYHETKRVSYIYAADQNGNTWGTSYIIDTNAAGMNVSLMMYNSLPAIGTKHKDETRMDVWRLANLEGSSVHDRDTIVFDNDLNGSVRIFNLDNTLASLVYLGYHDDDPLKFAIFE